MSQIASMRRDWTSAGIGMARDRGHTSGITWAAGSNWRLVVQEPRREWADAVKKRLDELCQLPRGWDGYRGRPVNFTTASFALTLLTQVCDGSSRPHIVPGSNGDLQIEWHSNEVDIELHVRRPYVVEAWRRTPDTDEDGETVEMNADVTVVKHWLQDMQGRASATETAAA